MRQITLGRTGITVPQNGFGALPIQRDTKEVAVALLRRAYEGGMRYFDTARAYSDSEEKIGEAFGNGWLDRSQVWIATKTMAKTPEDFWKDLHTSLEKLKTEYIDVYQFHQMNVCWKPGDGSGMYECMQQAKEEGLIHHIGGTAHKIGVAEEIATSGLYETLQFPFSYLADDRDLALVRTCQEQNVGFICMKGLAGGLLTDSRAIMAFISQYNVLPIWGIQREKELTEWLSYMQKTPEMTPEIQELIRKDRAELSGDFCRGCGYCMPCTIGITIHQCNRMSLMLRRAPSENWLSPYWQKEMEKAAQCIECHACMPRCPYELNIPELLKKNVADYQAVLAGKVSVK